MAQHKPIEITPENLGEVIKTLRNEKQLTQPMLAEMAGTYPLAIIRVENSQNSPSVEMLYKIATALGRKIVLK